MEFPKSCMMGKCSPETPIFYGKKPWFPVKIFPNKPIHWVLLRNFSVWQCHWFFSGGNDVGLWQRQVSDPIFCSEFSTSRNDSKKIPNFAHLGKISTPYLVGGFNSSEKYESQLGLCFPIYGKIKIMFQTNQLWWLSSRRWVLWHGSCTTKCK